MQIIYKKIDELIPYENNPRHNDQAVDMVAASIKEFGFKVPVIIDSKNIIVAGHTRIKAAKKLDITEVPCIIADDLTPEQAKAFRLADNKTGESSSWDFDLLALEFEGIDDLFTGFDMKEIEEITLHRGRVEEDDYDIEPPAEPKAKLGDIYQLGNHRLMCGDSTKKENIEKLCDEDIKCVFTSPPYNMAGGMYDNYDDNMASEEYVNFNIQVVETFIDKLDGFVFWNISYNMNSRYEFIKIANRIMEKLNFRELIIWDKKKGIPVLSEAALTRTYEDIFLYDNLKENEVELFGLYDNNRKLVYNKRKNAVIPNYWEITVPSKTQIESHKAIYPVMLPAKGIQLTTEKGDAVYDPFGGSGSTLIACEQLDRKCYMMELDPKYVDVIIDRWETFTGRQAEKINV